MKWTRSALRAFIKEHKNKSHPFLWFIAQLAPFGGTVISPQNNPYLLRIYLTPSLRKWGIPRPYLHYFFRGDEDRELHNHPWGSSWSYILTGGYTEHRWDPDRKVIRTFQLRPGDVNQIKRDDYHKVILTNPRQGCWTLFVTKDRVQDSDGTDWGFLNTETGEYTPWGEFRDNSVQRFKDAVR